MGDRAGYVLAAFSWLRLDYAKNGEKNRIPGTRESLSGWLAARHRNCGELRSLYRGLSKMCPASHRGAGPPRCYRGSGARLWALRNGGDAVRALGAVEGVERRRPLPPRCESSAGCRAVGLSGPPE